MRVSNCCGLSPSGIGDCDTQDLGLCPGCGEHCEYQNERTMPGFTIAEYISLLRDLRTSGYTFSRVEDMDDRRLEKVIFLRHDVDLHIHGVEEMATAEHEENIRSTYFIRLNGHYNPREASARKILREISSMGHEIGLHYDLSEYDYFTGTKLDEDAFYLYEITGALVRSICMHNPSKGGYDNFMFRSGYIHPHNPKYAAEMYVSDSCRLWRDDRILRCFTDDAPNRVLLNTHPELWLGGKITDNAEYIHSVVIPNGSQPFSDFCKNEMLNVWMERCSR